MLGVGHVTVGRRISLLERRLGVGLLNRTPDGFAATAAGEAILRQCIAMENAALDLERIAANDDAEVPALMGWRRELFGEKALALKHGKLALAIEKGRVAAIERE